MQSRSAASVRAAQESDEQGRRWATPENSPSRKKRCGSIPFAACNRECLRRANHDGRSSALTKSPLGGGFVVGCPFVGCSIEGRLLQSLHQMAPELCPPTIPSMPIPTTTAAAHELEGVAIEISGPVACLASRNTMTTGDDRRGELEALPPPFFQRAGYRLERTKGPGIVGMW